MAKIASPIEPMFAGPVLSADRVDGWDAMVADLTATFGDFDAPVYVTVADGVAAMDVGKLFYALAPAGDEHEGEKRLYLRIAAAPYYEDQGDEAAPVSRAILSGASGAAAIGIADGGTVADRIRWVTPESFDTSGGEDMAAAIIAALNAADLTGAEVRISDCTASPVDFTASGSLKITVSGQIINKLGAASTAPMIKITGVAGQRIIWRGGAFDANGGAHSCLWLTGFDVVDVDVDDASGIIATPASANSTSAIVVTNAVKSIVRGRHLHDLSQGTNTQGSVPRLITVQSTRTMDATLYLDNGYDAHGAFVIGNLVGGTCTIISPQLRNMDDNGVYNVGDAKEVNVISPHFDATEEPIVNTGSGWVNVYGGSIKNQTNAIGLQNCGGIRLIGVDIDADVGVFKARVGNVSSGVLEVRKCRVRTRPSYNALDFSQGILSEFIDDSNDWTIEYDSSQAVSDEILKWASGTRIWSKSSTWRLRDINGDIPDGPRYLRMPALSKESVWDSRLINETANNAAFLRLDNARQQLMSFKGLRSINNNNAEVEANYGDLASAPPRETWGLAAPTVGYWPAGSVVWNVAPAPYGAGGWRCVTAGSPGTWKPFGYSFGILSGAKSQSFAALAAGEVSAETDVTVTGAAAVDAILTVAFSEILPAQCVLHARIKSAGVVAVWLKNESSSATSATASGTLRVKVAQT